MNPEKGDLVFWALMWVGWIAICSWTATSIGGGPVERETVFWLGIDMFWAGVATVRLAEAIRRVI